MKASLSQLRMLLEIKHCGKWMSTCKFRTLAPLQASHHRTVCKIHVPAAAASQEQLKHAKTSAHLETSAMPMAGTNDPFVVNISVDARTLELYDYEKDDIMRFNGTWLRHLCHCPKCKQANSGQWLYNPADLSPTYTMRSVRLHEEHVLIEWNEEPSHCSTIPLVFLLSNDYSDEARQSRREDRVPTTAKGEFPTIEYSEVMKSGRGLLKWVEYLNEYGVCLVKSVPTQEDEVGKIAERIAPIQRTIYGTVFHVESAPNPINVAYSDAALALHTDLAYYESPPGLQFLHCIRYDSCVTGGNSYLVDAWYAAQQMQRYHPQEFDTLTRVPATFQKIHFNRDRPVCMKYQRPHIVVGPHHQVTGINWAPAFEGPLCVKEEDVEPYFNAYHLFATLLEKSDVMLEKRLEEGEMISFNNRRVLHARRGFELNGGVRHMQGCYVNIDEFKSKMEVLSRTIGDARPAKRVFNSCFF